MAFSARDQSCASIAADPNRALVVIDPRRTETAEMADYHLRVRPGTDAFCLAAILGVLVQEDLISHDYIRERTQNSDEIFAALNDVPVADYCGRAGLDETLVREVARRIARASSVSVYEDLGIEQSLHSTLNSYLEKLLFAVTGNVGKAGGMNAGTSLTGMFGGALSSQVSPVGGHRIIGGMIPANVIPDEILSDHPARFRAMLVESENPAHSVADSARMREALRALDFVVVIDVAMTRDRARGALRSAGVVAVRKMGSDFFRRGVPYRDGICEHLHAARADSRGDPGDAARGGNSSPAGARDWRDDR